MPPPQGPGLGGVGDELHRSWKVMSTPGVGCPNRAPPLRCVTRAGAPLPSRQSPPSSSGVMATGEKLLEGLDWKKPNPWPAPRDEIAQAHVVDQHQRA